MTDPIPPQALYTVAILGTFAGSSGAVLVLYNTFRLLSKRESIWVLFGISLAVSYVVAFGTEALDKERIRYFLAFLNACLLFTTAAGTQEMVARVANPAAASKPVGVPRTPRFASSWFH